MTRCPATTRVSLLAKATVLPASTAAKSRPAPHSPQWPPPPRRPRAPAPPRTTGPPRPTRRTPAGKSRQSSVAPALAIRRHDPAGLVFPCLPHQLARAADGPTRPPHAADRRWPESRPACCSQCCRSIRGSPHCGSVRHRDGHDCSPGGRLTCGYACRSSEGSRNNG